MLAGSVEARPWVSSRTGAESSRYGLGDRRVQNILYGEKGE